MATIRERSVPIIHNLHAAAICPENVGLQCLVGQQFMQLTQLNLPCLYRLDQKHASRVHRLPRNNVFTIFQEHMRDNYGFTTEKKLPHYMSEVAVNSERSKPVICTEYICTLARRHRPLNVVS